MFLEILKFNKITSFKLNLVALTGALVLSALTSSAQAQSPSVAIKKGQLQQAGWYKSNAQIQIVDDGPVVHDYRTAPHEDQAYQIPVGPAGTSGRIPEGGIPLGNGGPQMMRMAPNALPQSGFGTNMPARGMGPARALPGTEMGQLGKQYAADQRRAAQSQNNVSARPIGLGRGNSAAAAPNRMASSPASYGAAYHGSGGGYVAPSSSSSASVRAKLLGK
ncbi:hypothetical protein BH11CYA1_BH11CYA1_24310 [soil metagenome]